jgi:spore germination cell wall hydrolase CwlJ-like protein
MVALITGVVLQSTGNATQLIFKANFNMLSADAKKEVECLAENIYFEAAYEPKVGQVAVAFVTINRVKSGRFENDICGVVKQKIQNVCQFSWWCEERPKAIATSKVLTNGQNPVYNSVRDVALHVYANYEKLEDPSKGALFYHADYVKPGWRNMEYLTTIGRHLFYNRKDLRNL